MRRNFLLGAAFLLTVVLAGCKPALGLLELGGKAGAVKLQSADGKSIDISKMGSTVVLAFWVPGNPDSREGLDDLADIVKKTSFKGVKVLAVTRGKDKKEQADAKKEFAKYKWPFTLAFDSKLKCAQHLGVEQPLPAYYILGADHRLKTSVVRKLNGRIRNMSFSDMLSAAMKGKTIPLVEFTQVDSSDREVRSLIGKLPPQFKVKDIHGNTFMPLQFKGIKNLVIIFWSPSCPHCHRELPRLREFLTKYGAKYGVEVLAMSSGSGKDFVRSVADTAGELMIDFPVAVAPEKEVAAYHPVRVPLAYVINKNGVICETLSGENENAVAIYKSIFDDPVRMGMKK